MRRRRARVAARRLRRKHLLAEMPRTFRPTAKAKAMTELGGYDISSGTHGSVYTPGQTTVDPSEVAGTTPAFEMSKTNRAYYTAHHPDPERDDTQSMGWSWARSAKNARPDPENKSWSGRPVLHHVTPVGKVDHDENMGNYAHGAYTADQLKITDTEWIREPHQDELGVQGTLPHINWNQHAHRGFEGSDMNNAGISKLTGHMIGSVEHDDALWAGAAKNMTFPLSMQRKLIPGGSPRERLEAEGRGPKTGLPGDEDPAPPKAEQQRLF